MGREPRIPTFMDPEDNTRRSEKVIASHSVVSSFLCSHALSLQVPQHCKWSYPALSTSIMSRWAICRCW
jgi:hypothetical protein